MNLDFDNNKKLQWLVLVIVSTCTVLMMVAANWHMIQLQFRGVDSKSKGVITGKYSHRRYSGFYFEYTIDDKNYKSSFQASYKYYSIGDSIAITYLPDEPERAFPIDRLYWLNDSRKRALGRND